MAKMPARYYENPFMVSTKIDTTLHTIPSMSNANVYIDARESGYTPIGIVGYVLNADVATIRIIRISSSTEAQIVIGNPTSASININDIRLQILYQKVS